MNKYILKKEYVELFQQTADNLFCVYDSISNISSLPLLC